MKEKLVEILHRILTSPPVLRIQRVLVACLLFISYFFIVGPTALFMKLLRRRQTLEPESYWILPSASRTQTLAQLKRQF